MLYLIIGSLVTKWFVMGGFFVVVKLGSSLGDSLGSVLRGV